ncbi:type I-E CRISPR-associated protein Cas7/Cse4/CasC [Cellulomonas fimi]|uniref:CRISPR-associated protein, Cse4 family n=1 Tax=Cellulomonas fimi (strain ATCC 484 / DSM 20113 / JCM 1341 / CCUG 24087 / LMG 16345 / NBRC 15513 / NCIMB 8980 / NCTC 7547 / NRS-133) TaxID=590998 RepID=F4H8A1_CELFA|nr:type I-E CRISPR-associated protein Cas7/Cse4/CasC [Cellulomonas fimi]AEE44658.1 CRISPR-associated protein, Cse4 family [Cellulomonas fimi ATCC 484]NNH07471.1 type I-E CRISPR-associated protein Cas7/Cse4/CasC [Cellulomonas fimi]VEH26915.1 CRISPR-associated protein Cas7/Cse4/CasC, subtype I-E/ECOLI [Cellulomonas fimi]
MSRTIVEVHALQTVPPSNVNRDDTGSPKTAVFGGKRRARVSSQAWKRATRVSFGTLLDRSELGVRTKRVVELVAARICELEPTLSESAETLAAGVVASTGLKLEKAKRVKAGETTEHQETGYLVFVSRRQVDLLAEKAVEIAGAGDVTGALKALKGKGLLDTEHAVDVSLFGRMVADVTDLNVDAAAQVAHAISVHAVDNEYDYFTAVDDVKRDATDEDSGAGMIGTVEFNSSTLYRYATVDVNRLHDNLGDAEAARRAVRAFVQAFVESMPTGKQNTFANRTLPEAVVVTVRDTQPVNLVGAFEDAVTAQGDRTRLHVAAHRLGVRATEVAEVLGQEPVAAWVVAIGDARAGLEDSWADAARTTLPGLYEAVGELVAERLGVSA